MNDIIIDKVSKYYGSIQALQEVSLQVHPGELFGLIGPDGAGKTTLFRILATLLLPASGQATVAGHDVVKAFRTLRHMIGYMPGRFSLYPDLTVEENLRFFATVFGSSIEENYDLIKDIYQQIEPFKKRRAGQLSGGMKQKLALSCALIHRPEVLLLDEPTTGVDAVSRREFWEMLSRLRKKGITILVSTPYMDEANLCDRIALIQKGQILAVDTPAQVKSSFYKPLYAVKSQHTYSVLQVLRQWSEAESVFAFGDSLHLVTRREVQVQDIAYFLENLGFSDTQISVADATIEDCFMDLLAEKS